MKGRSRADIKGWPRANMKSWLRNSSMNSCGVGLYGADMKGRSRADIKGHSRANMKGWPRANFFFFFLKGPVLGRYEGLV